MGRVAVRVVRAASVTSALVAFLVAFLAAGPVPAGANAASSRDVAATHRALQAADTALSAVVRTWPGEEASFKRLDDAIAAECPGAGAGVPQDEQEQRLSYEVAGALWATAYKQDAAIAQTAIKAVQGLRWSSPALTKRVQTYLKGLREMIALPVPDLCADIKTWRAGGTGAAPANVVAFDEHVEAIDVEVPEARLFAAFVQPSERGLLARVKALGVRFEELEFIVGQREWNRLLEIIGLPQ